MRHFPIRARLTGAFVLAMIIVLITAGVLVYLRARSHLDEGIAEGLAGRVHAVAALVARGDAHPASADPESRADAQEGFAQVLTPGGRVVDAAGRARAPALPADELAEAAARRTPVDRPVPGVDGAARMLIERLPAEPRAVGSAASAGGGFVVVGQSLEDRTEALSGLVTALAVGGPLATIPAAILGYLLAAAALRPIEQMRRRAEALSLEEGDGQLPVPTAEDEVRRLGETLNEMLERLRRAFERERRFVADASHELRTPIAVVKTELETALLSGGQGPAARESVVAAYEECDRLAQLAEDLLIISRAADGRLPVGPERLDAADVLAAARDRFADRAREQSRAIAIDAPAGLSVWADPLRLRQALGNLIDNALRHGEGDVLLSARAQGPGVELEVTDCGDGFRPDVRERAFERFSRGNEARSGGGSGLGLAIVRAIADAHGGEAAIVVEPPGVRLWLPRPVDKTAGVEGTPAVAEPGTSVGGNAADSHPSLSRVP